MDAVIRTCEFRFKCPKTWWQASALGGLQALARTASRGTPEGSILLETVYRFKGQAADAVVLVGDLSDLENENQRNRMFVGMTRGRLGVSMVVGLS